MKEPLFFVTDGFNAFGGRYTKKLEWNKRGGKQEIGFEADISIDRSNTGIRKELMPNAKPIAKTSCLQRQEVP